MNEQFPKTEVIPTTKEKIEQFTQIFLGDEARFIDSEVLLKITAEVEKDLELENKDNKNIDKHLATYNRRKKAFEVGSGNVSMGDIVSSRRMSIDIELFESTEKSGDEKKILKLIQDKKIQDLLFGKLNKELAKNLSEKTKLQDSLKAKAYEKIYERSGMESKQFGVVAEQIIMGVLEGMAIDRPDLGFSVLEANAYQDVQNKIDFIISTKQKKRGVGIDRNEVTFEEKSIGIQFTTNTMKAEHKADQILKAKEKGVEVDDIIYVDLDNKILQKAVKDWEAKKKPVPGPWKFLSPEIRTQVVTNLFKGILSEEQIKSLLRNLK